MARIEIDRILFGFGRIGFSEGCIWLKREKQIRIGNKG